MYKIDGSLVTAVETQPIKPDGLLAYEKSTGRDLKTLSSVGTSKSKRSICAKT
jgi:hypothetical protein